jgi:hypothetical protein
MDPDKQTLLPHNRQLHALADLDYPRERLVQVLQWLLWGLPAGEPLPPEVSQQLLVKAAKGKPFPQTRFTPTETTNRAPIVCITSKVRARGCNFPLDRAPA